MIKPKTVEFIKSGLKLAFPTKEPIIDAAAQEGCAESIRLTVDSVGKPEIIKLYDTIRSQPHDFSIKRSGHRVTIQFR